MAIKVGMVSLGCPKNQVDAELMLSLLKRGGFELTPDAAMADAVIVNTCGFIESAKQESIDNILEFCALKEEGKIKKVIITGCLAERYKQEVATEIPEADIILGIGSNSDIVEVLTKAFEGEKAQTQRYGDKKNLPLCGERIISTLPFYAYLKISEGCDNCCSYCAIPSIRGEYRERELDDILSEAKWLADNGVLEVILVAQDTTMYSKLPQLLNSLCEIEQLKWIRLLYCYPERITDELLDTIAAQPKICKYLDLPIQHVNEDILRQMNRFGSEESLRVLIENIRERVPGITLRTTFIAGFPGETQEQFAQLDQFVSDMRIDHVGCFAYSQEEGTVAGQMENQLDEETKQERANHIMESQMPIMEQLNEQKIGQTVIVVVEGFDRYAGCYFGRTEADAPEIDGKVFFTSADKRKIGEFIEVKITEIIDYDLIGEVI